MSLPGSAVRGALFFEMQLLLTTPCLSRNRWSPFERFRDPVASSQPERSEHCSAFFALVFPSEHYLVDKKKKLHKFRPQIVIGGVAQLVRACGSYPQSHWFKSSHRHQKESHAIDIPVAGIILYVIDLQI